MKIFLEFKKLREIINNLRKKITLWIAIRILKFVRILEVEKNIGITKLRAYLRIILRHI